MEYGDRVPVGDSGERIAAKLLTDNGFHVETPPTRTGPWDLRADGHDIDVKAAIYTETKGSDGYPIRAFVFANMHVEPKVDFYLLLCLDADRKKVLTYYLVPATLARQRTLTLTAAKAKALEPYKENLMSLRKTASSPHFSEGYDRLERHRIQAFTPTVSHSTERLVDAGGVVSGAIVLGGLSKFKDSALGRRQLSLSEAARGAAAVTIGRAATRLLISKRY